MSASMDKSQGDLFKMIEEAANNIQPFVLKTPLIFSPAISNNLGSQVYLKLENEQVTGSFKVRGAFNIGACIVAQSHPDSVPIYTASTGNHGLACALMFSKTQLKGTIVAPHSADAEKLTSLKVGGANLELHGNDCEEAERLARSKAETEGGIYVSPYNDYRILAGQGTIGLEILSQMAVPDAVFVAVGGGGLISGIAIAVKHVHGPQVQVYGVSPVRSKVMHESVRAGRIIQEQSFETLSDGTAGAVEENSVTFPLCQKYVDKWVLVDEDEIAEAIFYVFKYHKKVIEGAAGVALAGLRKAGDEIKGKKVVVVLCGGNISVKNFKAILCKYA